MDWSSAASYHIVTTPGRDGIIEVQRKGRTTYICERKSHLVGTPELRLNTPIVDGSSSVASAKLKPSYQQCRVLLGDSSKASRRGWQSVQVKDSQYTEFGFQLHGREYLWIKLPNENTEDDLYAAMRLNDLQLVDAKDPTTILATYQKDRSTSDKALIGKFETMTDLGLDLELLGLISILGLKECQALQVRASKMPLAQGRPAVIRGIGVMGI